MPGGTRIGAFLIAAALILVAASGHAARAGLHRVDAAIPLAPTDSIANVLAVLPVADVPSLPPDAIAAVRAATGERDGALPTDRIVLFGAVRNAGAVEARWRVVSEALYVADFTVLIGDDDGWTEAIAYRSPTEGRRVRASEGRPLVSEPIVVSPAQTKSLLVIARQGTLETTYPIALRTENAYATDRTRRGAVHGLYFGVCAALLAFLLVFAWLLSSTASFWYFVYFASVVALNAHSYGYTSGLPMIGTEAAYAPAVRVFQNVALTSYLLFAAAFVGRWRSLWWLHRLMIAYLVGVVALHVLMVTGVAVAPWTTEVVGFGFLIMGTLYALTALHVGAPGASLFTVGYALLCAYSLISWHASFPERADFKNVVDDLVITLHVLDGLVFAASIVRRTMALRTARDAAIGAELVASRERETIARALLAAERDRDQAHAIAERNRHHLATTRHDLRQPLVSLRVALDQARPTRPDLAGKLATSIAYLDALLDQGPERDGTSVRDPAEMDGPMSAGEGTDGERAVVAVQPVFDTVKAMFAPEADARGLHLRFVPSGASVRIVPIDLMRMVANLVANAVRHARAERITVEAVPATGGLAIEVRDDGVGMDAATLRRVVLPHERGRADDEDAADGEGLGLDIVSTLAQRHGLEIALRSEMGAGTVARLSGLTISNDPSARGT